MSTDEHTPLPAGTRSKEEQRWDGITRLVSKSWPAFSALVLALAGMFIKTWSDNRDTKADIDKKADVTIQSAKPTTDALEKELKELKANLAKVAGAGAAQAEAIDDTPRPGRKRARSDRKLLDAATVVDLKKIEAKAKVPVVVPALPTKVPDEVPKQGGVDAGVPNNPSK